MRLGQRRPTAALAVAVGLLTAGCANDGPLPGAPGVGLLGGPEVVTEVTIVASELRFDITELEATVGEQIVFTYDNRDGDGIVHSLHVRGPGVDVATSIEEGPIIQTLTVHLEEPGEYEFFCDTHPHEMNGTIVVRTGAPPP